MTTNGGAETVRRTSGWEAPPGADPFTHWVEGVAIMGETPFSMPLITQVEGNLYQGGWVPGIDLGDRFAAVLSLYPWHAYPVDRTTVVRTETLYDSHDGPNAAIVDDLSVWVVERLRAGGDVLVHCQAGLNRSALIAAATLVKLGHTPDDAVALLRRQRSPAVLCNPTFETFVRQLDPT